MEQFYQSEKCFRRYEYYICQAVQKFPDVFSFTPPGERSPRTDAARCRDAITWWCKKRWQTLHEIDPVKASQLSAWYDEINNIICIGPRRAKGYHLRDQLRKLAEGIEAVELTAKVEKEKEAKRLTVEQVVDAIERGELTEQHSFPLTDDNLQRAIKAIEGKLNVAYYCKDDKLVIF